MTKGLIQPLFFINLWMPQTMGPFSVFCTFCSCGLGCLSSCICYWF